MIKEFMNRAITFNGVDAAWNTGREYSAGKQRMSALVTANNEICFTDIDRSIQGVLTQPCGLETIDPVALGAFVMREYDEGRYNSGFYALEDGREVSEKLKTAALAIGPDGLRMRSRSEQAGVADAALAVLKGYPQKTLVADLYDVDEIFAAALLDLGGETFEYPDHSHRTVGEVSQKLGNEILATSRADAGVIARAKASVVEVNNLSSETYIGKVLGLTSSHAVISIGRAALVVRQADLDSVPAPGADVAIAFKGGKGRVETQSNAKALSR